ncbi:unnamed protein product [Closterium sp. NIES-53]
MLLFSGPPTCQLPDLKKISLNQSFHSQLSTNSLRNPHFRVGPHPLVFSSTNRPHASSPLNLSPPPSSPLLPPHSTDCRTATTVLCLNPFTARQAPLSPSSSSPLSSPWVSSLAVDSTAPWLLCGTGGGTASLFSLQAPASALLHVSLGAPVHAVAMGRDADEILVAGASAVLNRLTFAGQLKSLTATAMPSIYSLHSHSPSQLVAVAGRGGTVDIITSIGSHLATFQCA